MIVLITHNASLARHADWRSPYVTASWPMSASQTNRPKPMAGLDDS